MKVNCAIAATIAVLIVGGSAATEIEYGCLFANGNHDSEKWVCGNSDNLHLANDPKISKMMLTFAISKSRVQFIACTQGEYRTSPDHIATRADIYRITYPADAKTSEYLAPITHELGHVFQLENASSLKALRAQLKNSSERIELGADFLAGIAFQLNMKPEDRREFQENLQLAGTFAPNDHGTPSARVSAFRFGYFYRLDQSGLAGADDDFQNNEYANFASGPL